MLAGRATLPGRPWGREVVDLVYARLGRRVLSVSEPTKRADLRPECAFAVLYIMLDAKHRIRYVGKTSRTYGDPLIIRWAEHANGGPPRPVPWEAAVSVWLDEDAGDAELAAAENVLIAALCPPDNRILPSARRVGN